jgi:hypothetical protein
MKPHGLESGDAVDRRHLQDSLGILPTSIADNIDVATVSRFT